LFQVFTPDGDNTALNAKPVRRKSNSVGAFLTMRGMGLRLSAAIRGKCLVPQGRSKSRPVGKDDIVLAPQSRSTTRFVGKDESKGFQCSLSK
jgi:hypothetical protein